MLLFPRVPWQLTCLLFASIATANITPSNSSTAGGPAGNQFQGTLPLKREDGDQAQIAELVPLTREAARRTITGNLYNTNFSNVGNITHNDIAYISCNPDDYVGFDDAQRVFEEAYKTTDILAVILYSTSSNYCGYDQNNTQEMMQDFPILSMTDTQDSMTVRDALQRLPGDGQFSVRVEGRGNNSNNSNGFQGQNPLGPSPSTAVAMIILYSITGIITALFLVIIITGAVRAHRHPERYGPRNVLGRPRQSRARGLGRAILDTIPIVKFGEKEPPKPTDVEMASTSESRNISNTQGATGAAAAEDVATAQATDGKETSKGKQSSDAVSASRDVAQPPPEHEEGIAPAAAVAATVNASGAAHDENLGCSICTEDFEKGQDLRVLPCDHKFHPECVDPWLLNVSGTCPLCRVDLHPVTSHDSNEQQDADELAPPLDPAAESSSRRRTVFRDILSLRHRPNATPEERIIALRRLREQRRNQAGEAEDDNHLTVDDAVASNPRENRRSRRMSARLSDVFSSRARRERRDGSPQPDEPSSSADQAPTPPSLSAGATPSGSGSNAR